MIAHLRMTDMVTEAVPLLVVMLVCEKLVTGPAVLSLCCRSGCEYSLGKRNTACSLHIACQVAISLRIILAFDGLII